MTSLVDRLTDAALAHVPFDGWSPATFRAAVAEVGAPEGEARAAAPRGAADLAVRFHERGDEEMTRALLAADLPSRKVRERIAMAVRARIEAIPDKEAVRRGAALFAMPHMAADGARLMWNTADRMWEAAGDTSDDVNWYTKRATLAGVYGATVLYWLGDESPGARDTWAFLDRRIDGILQIERAKGAVRSSPVLRALFAGPLWAAGHVRAPARMPRVDLPGHWPAGPQPAPAPEDPPVTAPGAAAPRPVPPEGAPEPAPPGEGAPRPA